MTWWVVNIAQFDDVSHMRQECEASPAVKRRSRALIAGSSLRLEFGGQEDAVLLGLLSLGVADDLCTRYLSRQ
jgi:hypothetical protein